MAKAECGNCDWEGDHEDGEYIRDIHQRVEPGEPMPACECPECGALCHLSDEGDAPARVTVSLPADTWRAVQAAMEFAIEQRQEELDCGDHDERAHNENESARADYQKALDALQAEIRG